LRPDNGAMVIVAWRLGGWPGLAAVVVLTFCVFLAALRTKGPAAWSCLVWLGIATLPVAWVYSLLPLLPWLVLTIKSANKYPRLLALIAIMMPYLSAAWVPIANPWFVALSIVFSGIAFALDASTVKYQQTSAMQTKQLMG
jgi:hypothetical protein